MLSVLLRSLQNFLDMVIAAICVVCGNAGLTLVPFVVCGSDVLFLLCLSRVLI